MEVRQWVEDNPRRIHGVDSDGETMLRTAACVKCGADQVAGERKGRGRQRSAFSRFTTSQWRFLSRRHHGLIRVWR